MASKKILIIDDDIELCEGLAEFLLDAGHIVQHTSCVFAGETLIEKHDFDVVILDYKMPSMTGIDMLKKIRIKSLKVQVFIVTGRPFIEKLIGEERMAHLVDGVISKPFNPDILLDKINGNLLPFA